MLLLDSQGRRRANTANPVDLGTAVEMPSVERVLTTGRPVIGSLQKGRNRYGIPVRAPIVRNGRVIGIVTVVLDPRHIHRALQSAGVPDAWVATVIDNDNRVVGRTRNPAAFIGRIATPTAIAARARRINGLYDGITFDGVKTQSAFWMSPLSGWSVHVGLPKAAFEAPLRRSALLTVLGLGLSIGLAGLFMVLLVREQRLRRMEAAAIEQAQRLEALGRLTGGVAHDFNNLLMIIKGNIDILSRRLDKGVGERQLSAIRIASDRATRLTRELLVFARGGASTKARVDLNATALNFLGALQEAVGSKIRIDLDLDPAAPAVDADRIQLEMAILNLAVNARDAMGGEGILTITTHSDATTASLFLCDTGTGLAAEDLHRAFDPFFTTKLAAGGTGLGLTQVYSFARQTGGRATIRNRKIGGASVRLSLPLSTTPIPKADPPPSPAQTDLRGRRVLLADDNDAVRQVAANYLRELGVLVSEAHNAADALSQFEREAFDALVSDIVMPGEMDGLGLARAVSAKRAGTPILLVSGYSASMEEARDQGLTVLPKPYDLPDLARELVAAVAAGGSGRKTPA